MLAPCKGPAITIWSFQVRIPLSVCWCLAAWLSCPFLPLVHSQDDIRELKLKDWQPRSMLVTRQSVVETPRFPVIDIHNHLGGGAEYLTEERVARYLAEMDSAGVRTVINLDGGSGQRLRETLEALDKKHPGRFLTFAQIDFTGLDDEGWSNREVERLPGGVTYYDANAGTQGIKTMFDVRLDLNHLLADIQDVRERVRGAF